MVIFNRKKIIVSILCSLNFPLAANLYAAEPINLSHVKPALLQTLLSTQMKADDIQFVEKKRGEDKNHTLHIRLQETYRGYPVLGGNAIIHIPKQGGASQLKQSNGMIAQAGSANGIIYAGIQADLAGTPEVIFGASQKEKAIKHAIAYQQEKYKPSFLINSKNNVIVYIDDNNKAHWAYHITLEFSGNGVPILPVMIMDAVTFKIYNEWDDIHRLDNAEVSAGGYGGNEKIGKKIYSGSSGQLPSLTVTRDEKNATCYFENPQITIYHYKTNKISSFSCLTPDPKFNQVYWNGMFDAVNGAYSPTNDALYGGTATQRMYQDWYGLPIMANEDGSAKPLNFVVHVPNLANAFWHPLSESMIFGDGDAEYYPLAVLSVTAHEMSHAFTSQHSDLMYTEQSGSINESFSDMASKALEFYLTGSNDWEISPEIYKASDKALRYMDLPSKDCKEANNGECSIDHISQYTKKVDVHFSSGIFNRVFYLISTSSNWDTKKAFDVMVQANRFYWTPTSTFKEGACGVLHAANDFSFDLPAVKRAFATVGIDTEDC